MCEKSLKKIFFFIFNYSIYSKMFNQNESKIKNLHVAIENNLTLSKQQISDFLDAFSICKYSHIKIIILKSKKFY